MEELVMNYIEDDYLTEDRCYSGFPNINFIKVEPNQLLTEHKDVQNGQCTFNQLENSIASNEYAQDLERGTWGVTTKEEIISQKEETLPQFDALSSIVILKVETVEDTLDNPLTFNKSPKEELRSGTFNAAEDKDDKITFKCDFCAFIGTSRFALARHKEKCNVEALHVTEHSEKLEKYSKVISFNCDVCNFFATSRFALARHKNSHRDEEVIVEDKKIIIFNCEYCSFSATSRFALARHQEEHEKHSEEKYVPVETTNQIIPKMRVFKCRLCDFTSKIRFALKRHSLSHRKPDTYTCLRCYNLVLTESNSEHLLKCKRKGEHFACDNCPYKTVYTKMFVKHQNSCKKWLFAHTVPSTMQQPQATVKNESNYYKCKYCPFTTKSHWTSTNHLKFHKSEWSTVKYPNMPATETTVKNESNYECKYCSFSTKINGNLSLHMRTHTLGRPIVKCKTCNFKSTYSAVSKHYLTCSAKNVSNIKKSAKSTNINNATKNDQSVQFAKHKCKYCSFTSDRINLLKVHLEKHTKLKLPIYKCEKCDFTGFKISVGMHMANKHDAEVKKHIDEAKKHVDEAKKHIEAKKRADEAKKRVDEAKKHKKKKKKYCTYCSYSCYGSKEFKKHALWHTKRNEPIVKCKFCKFKSLKHIIDRHLRLKHPLNYCHLCSYSTHKKDHLTRHLTIHESKQIKNCTKCSFRAFHLATHYRTAHGYDQTNERANKKKSSGEKSKNEAGALIKVKNKIGCDLCSYTTLRKHQLKDHYYNMHIKKNEPLLQCSLCDYKSFRRHLTIHYKNVHNKVKFANHALYHCKFCSFSSKYNASVRSHTHYQHVLRKSDIYECDYCEYKSTKYCLSIHLSKVHRQAKDSSRN